MRSLKRIMALLILSVMLISAASCTPTYLSDNQDVYISFGKYTFSADEYRYFYQSYKSTSAEGTTEETLKKNAETSLSEIAATLAVAEKYDIELTRSELNTLHDNIKAMKTEYSSEEKYFEDLEKSFMTEQVMFNMLKYSELEKKVCNHIVAEYSLIIDSTDKTVEEFIKEEFMAAVNVLIFEDTEADGLKGKALAEALRERISNGEDISDIAKEYSEDSTYKPRYFAPLTGVEFFEEKVKSMKVGELSEVYQNELGYNITLRIEITDEYINKNFDDLRNEYKYSKYLEIMLGEAKKLEKTYSDRFSMEYIISGTVPEKTN